MKAVLVLFLLAGLLGIANGAELKPRSDALLAHMKAKGEMDQLSNAEYLKRCELALDLLETPLKEADKKYLDLVYVPWRDRLLVPDVRARLKSIASRSQYQKRALETIARIDRLPDRPRIADKGVSPGPIPKPLETKLEQEVKVGKGGVKAFGTEKGGVASGK